MRKHRASACEAKRKADSAGNFFQPGLVPAGFAGERVMPKICGRI
ncbi:MAG TPA: hypothetical protein VMV33_11875 [Rhodocyclaceae bacterium]|nr:hypothetical protein [Rhodocyclaceae bacterium]